MKKKEHIKPNPFVQRIGKATDRHIRNALKAAAKDSSDEPFLKPSPQGIKLIKSFTEPVVGISVLDGDCLIATTKNLYIYKQKEKK
jgi:hypothetical protein